MLWEEDGCEQCGCTAQHSLHCCRAAEGAGVFRAATRPTFHMSNPRLQERLHHSLDTLQFAWHEEQGPGSRR